MIFRREAAAADLLIIDGLRPEYADGKPDGDAFVAFVRPGEIGADVAPESSHSAFRMERRPGRWGDRLLSALAPFPVSASGDRWKRRDGFRHLMVRCRSSRSPVRQIVRAHLQPASAAPNRDMFDGLANGDGLFLGKRCGDGERIRLNSTTTAGVTRTTAEEFTLLSVKTRAKVAWISQSDGRYR